MSEKGLGSKLLGIFVESESSEGEQTPDADSGREKSPAEVVAELARGTGAGAPGNAGRAAPTSAPPPNMDVSKLAGAPPTDFDAVFRNAGMDGAELDRVRKAEELLRTLPEATPLPVKKQIVEASLKAFGFEVDKIVQAAANQKWALDAYVKVNETSTAKAIQEAEAQIAAFNQKIAALRADIEKRTQALAQVSASATARKQDVQKVVDFFQLPATTPPQGS